MGVQGVGAGRRRRRRLGREGCVGDCRHRGGESLAGTGGMQHMNCFMQRGFLFFFFFWVWEDELRFGRLTRAGECVKHQHAGNEEEHERCKKEREMSTSSIVRKHGPYQQRKKPPPPPKPIKCIAFSAHSNKARFRAKTKFYTLLHCPPLSFRHTHTHTHTHMKTPFHHIATPKKR